MRAAAGLWTTIARAIPFAVIVDKLVHVFRAIESAQKEMMQHRIVQHHYSGLGERSPVNFPVQLVVAQMI
jgi:hypothetical protein